MRGPTGLHPISVTTSAMAVTSLIIFFFLPVEPIQGQAIEIDMTPHMERAGDFFNRLSRGAYNLMHWPVVIRRPRQQEQFVDHNQFRYLQPQRVFFSQIQQPQQLSFVKTLPPKVPSAPISSNFPQKHYSQYSKPTPNPPKSPAIRPGPPYGIYDSSDFDTTSAGGTYGAPSVVNRPQGPPRPSNPSNSNGWGWQSQMQPPRPHSNYGPPMSQHHHQPTSSGYSNPQSYGPPAHQPQSYGSPVQPQGYGWGWNPHPPRKICDINTEPPSELNSTSEIVPGSIIMSTTGISTLQSQIIPLVPQSPSKFSIGIRDLPPNYSSIYSETFSIDLNPPNSNQRYSVRAEVQDKESSSPSALLNQMPKPMSFLIVTSLTQSPNISAPLGGANSQNFLKGLDQRLQNFKDDVVVSPFESQLNTLAELFMEIESSEQKRMPSNGAPLLVNLVQRHAQPEPNSREKLILDSAFNFGPQANRISFGDLDLLLKRWEVGRSAKNQDLDVSKMGSSVDEVQDTFSKWVRGYAKVLREASATSFDIVENRAYQGFKQYQFIITPPGECERLIDPASFESRGDQTCAIGGVSLDGPAPGCFPPRRC